MNIKIKLFLAFLAIVAVFSVAHFQSTLRETATHLAISKNSGTVSTLPPIETDYDHDGLPDMEESYWNTDSQNPDTDGDGFQDGEEVLSGNDPTVPGPDDLISLDNRPQNITDKVGGLLLAGLYEGSLEPDGPDFTKSMEQITEEILRQYSINAAQDFNNTLRIVPATPNGIAEYRGLMLPLLELLKIESAMGLQRLFEAASKISDTGEPEYAAFFEKELNILDGWLRQLNTMGVPEQYVLAHNTLASSLRALRQDYVLLRDSKDDIYQGMVAYSLIPRVLFVQLPAYIHAFDNLYTK